MFDKSVLFIFPVCLLTVTWNIPKFFELKTCYLPLKVGWRAGRVNMYNKFFLFKRNSRQTNHLGKSQVSLDAAIRILTYCDLVL